MPKAEDVPEELPEMDELKPAQEEAIVKLLKDVQKDGKLPYIFEREGSAERHRLLAYKFLKARKWKSKDALTMVQEVVQYRAEKELDVMPLFPCAFPLFGIDPVEFHKYVATLDGGATALNRAQPDMLDLCYRAFQSSYVNVYHFTDKAGHPIMYDGFGRAEPSVILKEVARITPVGKALVDVVVPFHVYMNEVQYYVIRYADHLSRQRGGRGIMGITVIIDADGLSFRLLQKKFVNLAKSMFAVDQKYYPEALHRVFLINCPSYAQMAYNLVKSSLDENTRKKIVFCSRSESLEVLQRAIDNDHIPQELGGGCKCVGGCLPRYKKPEGEETEDGAEVTIADVPTEDRTVGAGKKYVRDIPVATGDEVSWEFSLETYEIHFSVAFEPVANATSDADLIDKKKSKNSSKKDKNTNYVVVKDAKLSLDVDTYVASQDGVVHLTWDNSSSWVHGKSMQLRVAATRAALVKTTSVTASIKGNA